MKTSFISHILFRGICLALFALLSLSLSSCRDEFEGRGPIVTRTVHVDTFDGLDFSSSARIEIIPSDDHRVEIDAEENITGRFNVSVHNGTLDISTRKHTKPNVRPVIRLYTNRISRITSSGSADIGTSGSFSTDNLDIRLSGSGDVRMFSTSARHCSIRISGSGDCEVTATETLDVHISGSGKVHYKGQPRVSQKISGSGSVSSSN